MKNNLSIFIFFIVTNIGFGQKPEPNKSNTEGLYFECTCFLDQFSYSLEAVYFSSSDINNYIDIKLDMDEEQIYEAPQYVNTTAQNGSSNGEIIQLPVAYVSSAKPMVEAVFLTDCTHSYYIRGIGIEGIEFEKQLVTPSNGMVTYPFTSANQAFEEGRIRYFSDFTIQW